MTQPKIPRLEQQSMISFAGSRRRVGYWVLVLRCAVLLLLTGIQVQWLGFERWKARLGDPLPGEICPLPARCTARSVEIVRVVERLNQLSRNSFTCLTAGLVAQQLLTKEAIPSSLVLGVVVKSGGRDRFEAHAWLWVERKVRLGRHDGRFRPVVSYLA